MEKERNRLTKRILNLTLEIIYLLTGEDYTLAKKTNDRMTPSNHHGAPGGWNRNHSGIIEPSPPFPTPEINNDKKILEVTQKMIELLTGEVPIRCQDVTVYFSMEEWEYLEEHKELYKYDVLTSQPALTSPDESSKRDPPERCPHPLFSRDSTHENAKTRQNDQVEDVIVIKAEVLEEAEKLMGHMPCKEEKISLEIRTDLGDTQKDFKTEKKKEGHGRIKEEKNPIEIRIDGRYRRYKMEDCSAVLPNVIEDENIMADPSGENSTIPNLQAVPQEVDLPSDPSTQDGTLVDHLYPGTYTVCRAGEPFLCYMSNNCCSQGSKRTSQPKSNVTSPPSECGKCFGHGSSFTRRAPEKTHPCSQCGRCFSQKSNLLRHLRFHTVDRPYMCSACSRCFSQKSDLLRHQRIHTGEKPYSCLVCGRCFAQKSNLLRHHRSHSGERPFSCLQCGKCFAKKQDLVSHQTKHTKMT